MGKNDHPVVRGIELANAFTVGDYLDAISQEPPGCEKIAKGIYQRFSERYLNPITSSENPHGFTMMAIACLMIEALESFRNGWPDTREFGAGKRAFKSFFESHEAFSPFLPYVDIFYKGIRCGILHQAETTHGWRILRSGDLLVVSGDFLTINAEKFVCALSDALDLYKQELLASEWGGPRWEALRIKMERVCDNCGAEQL